jgi:signal transduction histidine kinase
MNSIRKEIGIILFGFLVLLIVSITAKLYGIYNLQKMHEISTRITQHPLIVSNAALNFQLDVYKTRNELNHILFFPNQKELHSRIETIHLSDQSAHENLKLIDDQILGVKGIRLVSKATKLFEERKQIRDHIIALVLKNEVDVAKTVFKQNESSYVQLDALAAELNIYAKGRAALYQNEADELFGHYMTINLYIVLALALFFIALASYIVRRIAIFMHANEMLNGLLLVQSRYVTMGQMIGMIAHQWRQPLTVISMAANNIVADIELGNIEEKNLKEASRSIFEQTTYLSNTIDDFRNFFLTNKKKEELTVQEILEETQTLLASSLSNNEISFEISNECSGTIFINKGELIQVLINLINNAKDAVMQYQNDLKKITITVREKNNSIILNVCDNGGGIDESNIEKIFDPYFTTKEDLNGSGLGLYMSKIIITQHFNGTITAQNQEKGACFSINLPKEAVT